MITIKGLFLRGERNVGFIGYVQFRNRRMIAVFGSDMEEPCDSFVHAEYREDDGTVWCKHLRRRVGHDGGDQKVVLR